MMLCASELTDIKMNKLINELAAKAKAEFNEHYDYCRRTDTAVSFTVEEKFANLIVRECIDILRQEWYTLNNAPKVEGETPRDVGIRVGQKSELIKMIHVIKQKFENN